MGIRKKLPKYWMPEELRLYVNDHANMPGYIWWDLNSKEITLDGDFTVKQLKAIIYFVEEKQDNE